MLVLTRKTNEQIVIADGLITITVVRVLGGKVRLSIDAPRAISVHRAEVSGSDFGAAESDTELTAVSGVLVPGSTASLLKELVDA
ncbi:MAG: carbon storage regulator [Planctomycetaceae bacterium]|nr:carbon storage regulator [Planctomycetaceae bacterium]